MTGISRSNLLVVAIVVTVTVLGGAYALGHTLGKPGGLLGPATTHAQTASEASHPGTAPPSTTAPRPGTSGPATPAPTPESEPAPAPLQPEQGGPFGARVTTGSGNAALTFDDGPDPRYTPQVLAILREYSVKATFCLLGTNARAHPELVRAIAADGHTLCNHSWTHDISLGSRPSATILTDLTRTNQAIQAAVPDAQIAYFRQPGGNWTPSVVAVARQLGMTSLHWAVDPRDWDRPGTGNIVTTVTASASPGSIVLLHDGGGDRQGTVNALHPILINLGRRFGLVALPTGTPSTRTSADGTPSGDASARGTPSSSDAAAHGMPSNSG